MIKWFKSLQRRGLDQHSNSKKIDELYLLAEMINSRRFDENTLESVRSFYHWELRSCYSTGGPTGNPDTLFHALASDIQEWMRAFNLLPTDLLLQALHEKNGITPLQALYQNQFPEKLHRSNENITNMLYALYCKHGSSPFYAEIITRCLKTVANTAETRHVEAWMALALIAHRENRFEERNAWLSLLEAKKSESRPFYQKLFKPSDFEKTVCTALLEQTPALLKEDPRQVRNFMTDHKIDIHNVAFLFNQNFIHSSKP